MIQLVSEVLCLFNLGRQLLYFSVLLSIEVKEELEWNLDVSLGWVVVDINDFSNLISI